MIRSRLVLVVLATASLLSGTQISVRGTGGDQDPTLSLLSITCAGLSFAEGRLAAIQGIPIPPGQQAQPCRSSSSEWASATRQVQVRVAHNTTVSALRAQGLLRLVGGQIEEAVFSLETAAAREATNPDVLNDLAAAYLALAVRGQRPLDLLAAFEVTERVLTLRANACPALYNRAEILSRLYLRDRAGKAWGFYLDRCPADEWALAAQARLEEQREPTLAEQWRKELPTFELATQEAVDRSNGVVKRLPHFARLFAEERLLPTLAEAMEGRNLAQAGRLLALAQAIGQALGETTGDWMIHDAVISIADAERKHDPVLLRHLIEGHRGYGRAMDLYYRQRLEEARPLLAEAANQLRQGGSPFAGWAVLHHAICLHYLNPERATTSLLRLREDTQASRFPALVGRAEWILGTIENNLGHPEKALERYAQAENYLASSVGPQTSAFLHMLKAECYLSLGDKERAWRERLPALAATARGGEPLRRHPPLYEAAEALLQQGRPVVALAFAEELQTNARAWGNPTALAEAGLQRGRVLHLLGRHREALSQLERARLHAAAMPQSALRERISGSVALALGEVLLDHSPAAANAALSEALASRLDNGYLFQLTRLLTTRARAHLALGNVTEGEADLNAAIREHERIRGGLRQTLQRSSYFGQAQSAFDEMIRLQIDVHHNPLTALAFAERSRARLLLDLTHLSYNAVSDSHRTAPSLPLPLSLTEIQDRLPDKISIIQYAVLPDRIVAWVIRHTQAPVQFEIGASPLLVNRAVHAFRSAISRHASGREVRDAAANLNDLLMQPLELSLPLSGPLAIIPDRMLAEVPFSALFSRERSRFLIQEREIWIAPSATLFVTACARARGLARTRPNSVLAVGDPAFASHRYPRLARLADADEEAMVIAALYPRAELLRGADATVGAFLAAADHYSVLHFGGHSLLNSDIPSRSQLVFAPEGGNDGALYAEELIGRRLTGTATVVLAACTTVGARTDREALTGLATAFLAIGPPSVVASLWNVGDRPTRELMTSFHSALAKGASPGAALRQAQIRLLSSSNPDLNAPAAWAGFTVIGGSPEPQLASRKDLSHAL